MEMSFKRYFQCWIQLFGYHCYFVHCYVLCYLVYLLHSKLGMVQCFSINKVWSKFNETQQINASIYLTWLSLLILVPLNLTLAIPPTLVLLNKLIVFFTMWMVVAIQFYPKLYGIWVSHEEPDTRLHCRLCNYCNDQLYPLG